MNVWLLIAGISGAVAVGAGAYGWHWIEYADHAQKDIFNVGVQYHMWHTLALLAVAALWDRVGAPRKALTVAGVGLAAGTALFVGVLYLFGVTGILIRDLAPVGGFALIAGWLALAWAGWRWGRKTGD